MDFQWASINRVDCCGNQLLIVSRGAEYGGNIVGRVFLFRLVSKSDGDCQAKIGAFKQTVSNEQVT
jgi:hypothetical protein